MTKVIAFSELRKIKDSLPDGSIQKIAESLQVPAETVRNYFGGSSYDKGQSCGVHIEPGPDGGYVSLDDTTILDMALEMVETKEV
mgnify:CR=1 FL=1